MSPIIKQIYGNEDDDEKEKLYHYLVDNDTCVITRNPRHDIVETFAVKVNYFFFF